MALLLVGVLVSAWAAGALDWGHLERPISHVRGSDWDYQLTLLEACGRLWSAGQLPAWNPWTAAGVPLLANPEAPVFHPMAFAAMIAHPASVARVVLIVHMGIQAAGTAALARWLGASRWTLPLVAVGLMSTDVLVWRMSHGHLMMAQAAWIPVAMVMAVAVRSSLWAGALSGVAVAIAAHGGGHYPAWIALASTGLLLAVLTTTRGLRPAAALQRVGALAVTAGLLIAPRWIPTAMGLAESSRLRGGQAPRAMSDFSLVDAVVSVFAAGEWTALPRLDGLHEALPSWSTPLFGLLALLGIFLAQRTVAPRRVAAIALLAVLAAWASIGHNAPVNLFGLLHALEPLDRFRNPERWAMTWVPMLVALSAVGVSGLLRATPRPSLRVLAIAGTAVLMIGHLKLAWPQVVHSTHIDQITADSYQRVPTQGPPTAGGQTEHWVSNFESAGRHITCLPCSDALLHEAPPGITDGAYVLSEPAELLSWTPTEVSFELPLDPQANPRIPQGRVVVLPQAHHPGWEAVDSTGLSLEVKAHEAGTAVTVPIPGRTVRLSFVPPGWPLGRSLGLLGIVLVAGLGLSRRRDSST